MRSHHKRGNVVVVDEQIALEKCVVGKFDEQVAIRKGGGGRMGMGNVHFEHGRDITVVQGIMSGGNVVVVVEEQVALEECMRSVCYEV